MEQAALKTRNRQGQDCRLEVERSADRSARGPMREVEMRRLDMYVSVHKGLRNYMSDVLATVGRMDCSDAVEVAGAVTHVRGLLDICRRHLHHENQFIHPAMESRRPGSACATAGDHVGHEKAIEVLEADLLEVETSSGEVRATAGLNLYRRLALFVAENFEHMHKEEKENNAVLWATHTDEEIAAIQDALVASIPPEKMAIYLRWIIPAMTPADRAEMLSAMRLRVPDEAFVGVLASVKSHLAERDWTKLMRALGEGTAGAPEA